MIDLFTGEFGVSPVPLQLSLNWCSHACSYCFANLNKPGRAADVKALQSQLKNFHGQNNLVAQMLREGYPVLISNLVDPFATSNYQISVPVIEQLTDLGVPVCIQTRGGRGVDDVLSFLPPSVWYISIPTLDDNVRKRIEVAAPSIPSRLELISKLLAKGHKVVVGANPMDWIDDQDAYVATLMGLGVTHFWLGLLHFSHEQVRNMPPRAKDAIGEDMLKSITGKRSHPEHQVDAMGSMIDILTKRRATWFSTECLHTTDFFDLYSEGYPNHFPTVSQFLSEARRRDSNEEFTLTLADWIAYAAPKCPAGIHHMPGYLFNRDRNVYEKNPELPKRMNFEELLSIMWNNPKFLGVPYFRETGVLIENDPDLPGEVRYSTDAKGNLRYRFHSSGNAEEYAEAEFINA
jgi:DNA repair photolyase